MKPERRWSFSGRMTRLYLISTSLLVVAVSAVSFWYLERSVQSELDALTVSLVKEFRLEYEKVIRRITSTELSQGANENPAFDVPQEDLEEVARTVARRHAQPCAWRVWEVNWGRVRGEFGHVELLSAGYPLLEPTNRTRALGDGLRWRTELLSHGLAAGLVLDGSEQMSVLRSYQALALALLVLAALVSLALGAYMIQHMSRLLRRVAASARAARDPTTSEVAVEVRDAPEEIREVVEALHELFANIRAESERSRVFYASMAHELRSPIQNLVGETEVALIRQRDGDAYRRVLESNLDELRDLGDAIDNLVTICSERRPGQDGELEEFDLLDEARIRLAREASQALRHGVRLELDGRGGLRLRGDREGLLRALRNLAANAIQWSPPGSSVQVYLRGEDDLVRITVDDAGPGVPDALRQQLFAPFVRGPAAAGQRIGYGLGLAIVRSAVDAQGGRVEIERSPAGGARFRVTLPREPAPERGGPNGAAPGAAGSGAGADGLRPRAE